MIILKADYVGKKERERERERERNPRANIRSKCLYT